YYMRHNLSCVFFFSSRRRHTRFSRDWSSDVCSSDLSGGPPVRVAAAGGLRGREGGPGEADGGVAGRGPGAGGGPVVRPAGCAAGDRAQAARQGRSEERRVGKECRASRPGEPEKKDTATT